MSSEFLVEIGGKIYEISELVKSVSWEDQMNDGCSKLTFSYLDKDLSLPNGSVVRFKYDGAKIFYGYVFKHEHNRKKEVTVTAYDQLRYGKAKDTIVCKKDTVATLTKKMCNYLGLHIGTLEAPGCVLTTSVQDSKTWLDMIYGAIDDTLRAKNKWFILRDEFGSVCLRNINSLKSNLILGDKSLCYDYTYSKSIDDDFYNQIKLAVDNEVTGKRDIYMSRDSKSISKYGMMQYFEVLSFSTTSSCNSSSSSSSSNSSDTTAAKKSKEAQKKAIALEMVNALLSLYDGETETLTLECVGDTSVRAGMSFPVVLGGISLNKRLIAKSVTHTFLPAHTMSMEVRI